eukprot:s1156_g7.t1
MRREVGIKVSCHASEPHQSRTSQLFECCFGIITSHPSSTSLRSWPETNSGQSVETTSTSSDGCQQE